MKMVKSYLDTAIVNPFTYPGLSLICSIGKFILHWDIFSYLFYAQTILLTTAMLCLLLIAINHDRKIGKPLLIYLFMIYSISNIASVVIYFVFSCFG